MFNRKVRRREHLAAVIRTAMHSEGAMPDDTAYLQPHIRALSQWPELDDETLVRRVAYTLGRFMPRSGDSGDSPERYVLNLIMLEVASCMLFGSGSSRKDLLRGLKTYLDSYFDEVYAPPRRSSDSSNLMTPADECNFPEQPKEPEARPSLLNPENLCIVRNAWRENIDFDEYMAIVTAALARGERVWVQHLKVEKVGKQTFEMVEVIGTDHGTLWTTPQIKDAQQDARADVQIHKAEKQLTGLDIVSRIDDRLQAYQRKIDARLDTVLQALGNLHRPVHCEAIHLEASGDSMDKLAEALRGAEMFDPRKKP